MQQKQYLVYSTMYFIPTRSSTPLTVVLAAGWVGRGTGPVTTTTQQQNAYIINIYILTLNKISFIKSYLPLFRPSTLMLYAAAVGVVAVFQLFFSGGSRLKNALRRHQICTLRTMYVHNSAFPRPTTRWALAIFYVCANQNRRLELEQ